MDEEERKDEGGGVWYQQALREVEELETKARDKKQYELEDSIGKMIEDIIEDDIEQERLFRKEVSKYIDEKIESEIVRRAYASGSIAQA